MSKVWFIFKPVLDERAKHIMLLLFIQAEDGIRDRVWSRGRGNVYNRQVLHGSMEYLKKESDVEIFWCNARVTAFGFYEKMGFTILGEAFDIPNLGPHKTGYIEL